MTNIAEGAEYHVATVFVGVFGQGGRLMVGRVCALSWVTYDVEINRIQGENLGLSFKDVSETFFVLFTLSES